MKSKTIKFLVLGAWFSLSIVWITSCTSCSSAFAAVVNLYFCVSVLKKCEKEFDDFFKNVL